MRAFGDHIAEKFHGTSNEGIEGITKEGFRIPHKAGMYGKGIYFATDSSKSAQQMYTKGSNKLLLCRVLLGKSFTVSKACDDMTDEKLRERRFDSVFAPRNTKASGGVLFDEFVIYDPGQAYPEYVISYDCANIPKPATIPTLNLALTSNGFAKQNVKASRVKDPDDPLEFHFAKAEAHFLKMKAKHRGVNQSLDIKSIDVVNNPTLEAKFEAMKAKLKAKGCGDEVYAFHGTKAANVDSILEKNLDPGRPTANGKIHGPGVYLSEFPSKSMAYGDALILFRLLQGQSGVDCKIVNADQDNYSVETIIQNPDQCLPCYVYHFN